MSGRIVLILAVMVCAGCRSVESRTASPGFSVEPGGAARVGRVIPRLVRAVPAGLCRHYEIKPSAVPNASIDTRGRLVITTGLLELCETDDLLAFAVAHELEHAALGHPQKLRCLGMVQWILAGAVTGAAAGLSDDSHVPAAAGAAAFSAAGLLMTLPAMRRMELEADLAARDLLRRTGFRIEAAAGFWRRYAAARPVGERPAWCSTHPPDAMRIRALEAPR